MDDNLNGWVIPSWESTYASWNTPHYQSCDGLEIMWSMIKDHVTRGEQLHIIALRSSPQDIEENPHSS